MLNDFYDVESEAIVNYEAFYGPKKNLVEKCLIVFSRVINDYMLERDYQVEGLTDANHNLDKLEIALRVVERI